MGLSFSEKNFPQAPARGPKAKISRKPSTRIGCRLSLLHEGGEGAQEGAQNIEQMLFLDSRAPEPATFEKI